MVVIVSVLLSSCKQDSSRKLTMLLVAFCMLGETLRCIYAVRIGYGLASPHVKNYLV